MEPDSLREAAPLPPSAPGGCKKYSPRDGALGKGTTAPEGAGPELVGHCWRERFESSTEPCDAWQAIHVPRPPGVGGSGGPYRLELERRFRADEDFLELLRLR